MDLLSRAAEAGIEPSFTDVQGHVRVADPAVLKTLLAAMPARRPHRWFAEPVVIDPSCSELLLERAGGLSLAWELRGVDGFLCMAGETTTEILELPRQLAPGVYVLSVRDSTGREDQTPLIVTSRSAWQGKFGRVWIVAVQLYGLRSATNWGVGDFSDLTAMLKLAVRHGAAGVGLNPLHVLFDECPEDCSPYAPSSRLFLNMLYIDPTRAPGFPQDFIACHAAEIARLRQTPLVDYQAVAALKQEALRTSFMHFRNGGAADDHLAFEQFQAERGRTLRRFACFEVLRRRLGSPWWNWPSPWNSPCDDELEAFREGVDADEVVYREYLQWVADSQLGVCAKVASDLRMPIGLYLDVAVGVKPDGFDAWNEQIAISRDAAVGAPPDPMNTAGQNWGLAGFNATGLEQRSFAPFRDMLRASMRHAGAVRLDHVLGLQRIF